MAGTASPRALTRRAARPSARFTVSLATAADDEATRRLLREHPLPGEISVGLEREPDTALAATVEGDVHQMLVARERNTGRIAAVASRSVGDAYINGRPARLGYFGQFRVAPPFRASRDLLEAGFSFCLTLHEAGDAPFYLTSIVAGNEPARRLFVGFPSAVAPRFTPAGSLTTLVIPLQGLPRLSPPPGVEIRRASIDLTSDIVECLGRSGSRHQFAPCWTSDALRSNERTRGLSMENFAVATSGGRVVGCVAVWDQRAFKQAIVRGYSRSLTRWRWIVNAIGRVVGSPKLPPVGSPLEFIFLSHLTVDDDRPEIASALIAAACRDLASDVQYVVTGLPDAQPMLPALTRRFRHRRYRTLLHVAYWPDGEAAARALDGRLPDPEVAIL